MVRKKSLRDLYYDQSEEAKTFSNQALSGVSNVEQELPALIYARDQIEAAIQNYKPFTRMPMSTFDPSVDETDPAEHRRRLRWSLRQVASSLKSAKLRITDLETRYAPLLEWAFEEQK